MMSLKKLCSTFILTLVLATSVLAGDMECPITSPTPPAATTMQGSSTETPSNPSSATGDATSATAAVAGAVLGLVGSVAALF